MKRTERTHDSCTWHHAGLGRPVDLATFQTDLPSCQGSARLGHLQKEQTMSGYKTLTVINIPVTGPIRILELPDRAVQGLKQDDFRQCVYMCTHTKRKKENKKKERERERVLVVADALLRNPARSTTAALSGRPGRSACIVHA